MDRNKLKELIQAEKLQMHFIRGSSIKIQGEGIKKLITDGIIKQKLDVIRLIQIQEDKNLILLT